MSTNLDCDESGITNSGRHDKTEFDQAVFRIVCSNPNITRFPHPVSLEYHGLTTSHGQALLAAAGFGVGSRIYPVYDLVLGAVKRLRATGRVVWVSKDGYTWVVDARRGESTEGRDWVLVDRPINACNIPSNWDEL